MPYNETPTDWIDMLQNIDGKNVYVVVITEGPSQFPFADGGNPALTPYAEALNAAYMMGLVKEPGKYAIEIDFSTMAWAIHHVIEN